MELKQSGQRCIFSSLIEQHESMYGVEKLHLIIECFANLVQWNKKQIRLSREQLQWLAMEFKPDKEGIEGILSEWQQDGSWIN